MLEAEDIRDNPLPYLCTVRRVQKPKKVKLKVVWQEADTASLGYTASNHTQLAQFKGKGKVQQKKKENVVKTGFLVFYKGVGRCTLRPKLKIRKCFFFSFFVLLNLSL